MPNVVVLGGQWGDEGKGKIVDLLMEHASVNARFAGGHNAGHTVKIGDVRYALHLVPCGILRPNITCIIGNGVVVEPGKLLSEITQLEQQGIDVEGRLFVSERAHLVLPCHPLLDGARESRSGSDAIGTTKRGIGPAYADKALRTGLRVVDLYDPGAADRMRLLLRESNDVAVKIFGLKALEIEPIVESFFGAGGYAEKLQPYVDDTSEHLLQRMDEGDSVVIEGAQGALLDIDHGTYPFVTSSNSTVGGACTGLGIPPSRIDGVLGIFKAYCTRVGGGSFPTELLDVTGETIRKRGNEYGTTTGRPRRCGWFDAVAARHAIRVNGIGSIALTLLDVLDEFEEIRICTAYERGTETTESMPAGVRALTQGRPVYRTVKGWRRPLTDAETLDDFPEAARDYLSLLEDLLHVEIAVVSVGPERRRTIVRDDSRFWRLMTGEDGA